MSEFKKVKMLRHDDIVQGIAQRRDIQIAAPRFLGAIITLTEEEGGVPALHAWLTEVLGLPSHAQLAAEVEGLRALVPQWQGIETAPKTLPGEAIAYVLVDNGHHVGVGYRWISDYPGDPEWYDESGNPIEPPPVGWMPRPASAAQPTQVMRHRSPIEQMVDRACGIEPAPSTHVPYRTEAEREDWEGEQGVKYGEGET